VKKNRPTIPNFYLRSEREHRGWTRAYVAEKLNLADPKTVGRWERGISSPNAHFQQRLCELFGKTPQELGLLQRTSDEQREEGLTIPSMPQSTPSFLPTGFLYDPAAPFTSTYLIGRNKLLRSLKQSLCSNRHPVCVAIHGLPGVGKTALSEKLVHDHDIRTYFCDGTLWARVGPKPNVLGLFSRWGALLGIPAVQMEKLTTYDAWHEVLRAAINTRRILFVIDDIWNIDDAVNLKIGGPNCVYLITTRFPDIALKFAPGESIALPELNISEGLALLAYFVPELVSSESHAAQRLVQLVGGLPLALTLMGKYLQRQTYSGQPRRMKTALERLQDAEERLRLTEPQAALERSPNLPAETPFSLQAVIETSDRQLDENTRNALYALSIFPAKPNSFSEEAALAISAMPVETLDTLTDAGLLESSGPGRYTLHQTIVDYARTKYRDKKVEERLVSYIARYMQQHARSYETLEAESNNILVALNIAYELQMQKELVQITDIFAPFLYMRGLYSLAEEHLIKAYDAANSIKYTKGVISILAHKSEIARKNGYYAQTEAYLRDGISLARQFGDPEQMSLLLGRLGIVIELQGNYVQAEACYLEGLALARQFDLHEHISRLLSGLGMLTGHQGNYVQAEAHLKEALALTRRIGLREGMSTILTTLGWIVTEQGNYAQAEAYLKEGLDLARQIGSGERIAGLLWALGMTATDQGNYAQAEEYLKEGLELARQLSHRELISELLLKLGIVVTDQGDYKQAEIYLKEGLKLAYQLGHNKLISDLLQKLGIVATKRGNNAQAEAYLRKGLAIARQIGHRELICALLLNLGEKAIIQEDYIQAEKHLEEGLTLARQLGHRKWMSMLLSNLGRQANELGYYAQAEIYLQEGLELARQLGIPQFICILLYNRGDLQLNQQQDYIAETTFREMLSCVPEGCQDLIASARYGLARVAALQNNIYEARQLGQTSLTIFEKIGHYRTGEIRHWLDTLPSGTGTLVR